MMLCWQSIKTTLEPKRSLPREEALTDPILDTLASIA